MACPTKTLAIIYTSSRLASLYSQLNTNTAFENITPASSIPLMNRGRERDRQTERETETETNRDSETEGGRGMWNEGQDTGMISMF